MTSTPNSPTGAGVRLAMPVEAAQIAEIQRREWADDPHQRRFLEQVSLDEMTEVWHAAIVRPPLAHHRVLVATEPVGRPEPTGTPGETRIASRVVGYAVVGPSDDEDADPQDNELSVLWVDAAARERGHEARLLNAAVDTMRADGYLVATCWVTSTDDALRLLLTESGFAPDGAHRELGTDDGVVRLKQVRLHADITEQDALTS